METKDLIINKKHDLKVHHKLTAAGLTLLFWSILVYLWQPLISVIAWGLGYKLFYEHMIVLGGVYGFLELLYIYAIIITVLACSLLIWAKLNQLRFQGKDKRQPIENVTQDKIIEFFKVSSEQYDHWKNQKNITLLVADDFSISSPVKNKKYENSVLKESMNKDVRSGVEGILPPFEITSDVK